MKKKIGFIFEEDYLGSYPSFVESIRILSEQGFVVDILGTSRESKFPAPPKFNENVNIDLLLVNYPICRDYPTSEDDSINNIFINSVDNQNNKSSFFKSLIPIEIKNIARSLISDIKENLTTFKSQKEYFFNKIKYFFFVFKKVKRNKYDILIGVDFGGGAAAYLSYLFNPTKKFLYWGLEIMEPHQERWAYRLVKHLEIKACQTADAIISTDTARIKDVCKANRTNSESKKVLLLPHSPKGFCKRKRSSYFQDLFSLDDTNTTILHSGWIHEVMCSKDLAQESRRWPQNWRLIFHERMKRTPDESYIQEVINAGDKKTLLSLNPVEYDLIDEVVLSADIGVVIYDSYEKYGTSWISLAKGSGKIAHYLRCGKPVVCRNLPGFKEIIEKYQCGVMFDNINEIETAITKILGNYDFYHKNAYDCYKHEYEFGKYFKKVTSFLKA